MTSVDLDRATPDDFYLDHLMVISDEERPPSVSAGPTAPAGPVLDWPFPRTPAGEPSPAFAELRRRPVCPVRLPAGAMESQDAWLMTRYADVRQALADPRLSVDETRPGAPVRIQLPPGERPSSLLRMDDPDHARLRSLIAAEFTARRVRAMAPTVRRLIDQLLDDLAALPGAADLQDVYTRALPTMIIAVVMGVPTADTGRFVQLTRDIFSQDDPQVAYLGYTGMTEYLHALVVAKQAEPSDDLISRLTHGPVATGEITADELVGMARLVLIAGHETTTMQLALAVLSLLRDDDLKARVLADDGARIPAYLEESVRYWSISQDAILRQATVDLRIGGAEIRAGDAVIASLPAANHDPEVFPNPGVIDLDRESGKHLQWGHGTHFCLGAPLARLEMEWAVRALFERFPTLRLAVEDPAPLFRMKALFFGMERLPVTW